MKPFNLQRKEILAERCQLSPEDQNELLRLQRGYEGESAFRNLTLHYIPKDWVLECDLTFSTSRSAFQVDALLISPDCIYHFEVKNYQGNYVADKTVLTNITSNSTMNPASQLYFNAEQLKRYTPEDVPLISNVVFIQEEETIRFHNEQPGNYLMRWEFIRFLKQRISRKRDSVISPIDVAKNLRAQTIPDYSFLKMEDMELVNSCKCGILCQHCNQPMWRKTARLLTCRSCNKDELMQRAVIRTICDYGVLHFNEDLHAKRVYEFIGECLSYHTLQKTLKKYFTPVDNEKTYLFYKNPVARLPYNNNLKKFH